MTDRVETIKVTITIIRQVWEGNTPEQVAAALRDRAEDFCDPGTDPVIEVETT